MNRLFVILMTLAAYPVFCGWQCGPPLNEDPGFDLWCIDNDGRHVLCAWELDKGEIKRVPTWHRSDYGVELVGDPVILTQLSATAMGIVDSAMVGRLGATELAAVGFAGVWSWTVFCLFFGTASGLQTFVAQADGAGRRGECACLRRRGRTRSTRRRCRFR